MKINKWLMRRSAIFFLSCLSLILGVAFHSIVSPAARFVEPFYLYLLFLILLVLSFPIFPIFKKRWLLAAFLGGSFFILGLWRYSLSVPKINENHIALYNGRELVLQGTIDDEPDIRDKSVRYTIKISNYQFPITNGNSPQPPLKVRGGERGVMNAVLNGKILLIAKPFPEYKYGDEIKFGCKLEKPEPFEDFDYAAYLSRYEIYSICRFPQNVNLISRNKGSRLMSSLYFLKNKFVGSVNRILPEPQASFLGGILYGAKRSIPEKLTEAFKKTGTAHLIALSGYNISIVAGFIIATLSWFWIPRRLAFPLASLAVLGFVLLTGAQASVVRAGIMGIIVLLVKNIGRLAAARNILTFSAAAMLLQNPKILIFDLGFQLSFVATLGLILLSSYFAKKLKFLPTWLNIREAASATSAAIIFTFPLLLYNFGTFSLIAPLANILVVPFIPLTMALGFTAALFGLSFLPLGIFAGWFVWLPLTYEISVIKWLANFPTVEHKIPFWVFLGMYGMIIPIILLRKSKIKNQK